jgi:hypothetical protein
MAECPASVFQVCYSLGQYYTAIWILLLLFHQSKTATIDCPVASIGSTSNKYLLLKSAIAWYSTRFQSNHRYLMVSWCRYKTVLSSIKIISKPVCIGNPARKIEQITNWSAISVVLLYLKEFESRPIYNAILYSTYAIISPIRSIFLLKRMLLCIFTFLIWPRKWLRTLLFSIDCEFAWFMY